MEFSNKEIQTIKRQLDHAEDLIDEVKGSVNNLSETLREKKTDTKNRLIQTLEMIERHLKGQTLCAAEADREEVLREISRVLMPAGCSTEPNLFV